MKINHKTFVKENLHKLVKDLLSEDYHGLSGTWSSSQFKDLLDGDDELFINKYIKKLIPRVEREVFDTGTYFHTATLEPHKVSKEIAVFQGKIRRGKEWDRFQAKHKGKCIISKTQQEQGDLMVSAVKASATSQSYLDGEPEVSLFVQLVVCNGRIYAPKYSKVLTPNGWKPGTCKIKDGYPIIVKVRADTLGHNYVSDLKSTSGNAKSAESIRGSISKYKYDLSAALYLDMFSLVRPELEEFVWIFASKSTRSAQAWRATNKNILVGRAKYMHAMLRLADCAQSNWEVIDCLKEAEPLPWELEWLNEKDTDLL